MYVSITYRIFKLRTYEFSFNINFKTLKIKITMIGVRFLFLCGFHTGLACYGPFFTWHASGYYHVAFILDSLATVLFGMTRLGLLSRGFHTGLACYGPFSHDTLRVIIAWLSYWTRLLGSFFAW